MRRDGPEGPPSGIIYSNLLVYWSVVVTPGGGLDGLYYRVSLLR